jgi:signal transduction histidine kinase
MPASIKEPNRDIDASLMADALMVARMRLVLSVSALLAVVVDTGETRHAIDSAVWLAFSGYVLHSLLVYACTRMGRPYFQGKAVHWSDVLWFTLIVFATDGVHSLYFLFYFFAILTSSFRWGYEEGARVAVVSVASFTACGLGTSTGSDAPQLLMRAAFLLALGHMIVHWGGSKVELQRRLALLSHVSRLSNPRFGVGRTIACTMEKTLAFFKASHCLLLMRDAATGDWVLRTLGKSDAGEHVNVELIGGIAESPLMALAPDHIVLSNRLSWPLRLLRARSQACDTRTHCWRTEDERESECSAAVATMLEARSFISTPLPMRLGEGRVYVSSCDGLFSRSDALFLAHIMGQVFPVIETIEVLDRMASEAASKERLKLSLDLHDTAIQPYIGLKMGLSALRKKAAMDNPLIEDLDRLTGMAENVIADLRRYAGTVKHGAASPCEIILPHLHRQVARIKGLYGIDIAVAVDDDVHLDDRMTAEILQLVGEGLNNICKHTHARRGCIRLGCKNDRLQLRIENEACDASFTNFRPHSITERAAALGGRAQVCQSAGGATAVLIEIPI